MSDNEEIIQKARYLATQARDKAPHYQHSQIGYNYRMSNIVAGIGRGQLEIMNLRIEQRRENNRFYRDIFKDIKGITFLSESSDSKSNYWLTTILVDPTLTNGITREDIRIGLEKDNIESWPLWKPMHLQPVFKDAPFYGNGFSEFAFIHGLCLPSGSNLTIKDKTRIKLSLNRIIGL